MRALAQFIMRGRLQASLVAFIGNFLPILISPAVVALVVLRKGLAASSIILLWGLLPLVLVFNTGAIAPMLVSAIIAIMLVTTIVADELRRSVSWSRTLLLAVVLSVVSGLILQMLFPGQADLLLAEVGKVLEQVKTPETEMVLPGTTFLLGLVSYAIAIHVVICLFLARWWQALLYNPNGFQSEFHNLRLGVTQAWILMVAAIGCYSLSEDYLAWGKVFELPLLLCGIALVHYTVKQKQLGGHWLVLFYVGLILTGPLMSTMLLGIGFIDSTVNLRSRINGGAK